MAEALEDRVVFDPREVDHYHSQIRIETERLAAMIDDLFELSKIHAGALRLSPRVVGLEDLIADVVASAAPVARAKRVRLTGSAVRGMPVLIDSAEFGRAVRNLVINAIRHTPPDGTIEILGELRSGVACVSVSDECGGIPLEDLPRVFDVAFRGESARTPDPSGGAGLGLSIARGIVEAHSGDISVRNTGPGCQFLITLPLARVPQPRSPAGAVMGGPGGCADPRSLTRARPSHFRKAGNRVESRYRATSVGAMETDIETGQGSQVIVIAEAPAPDRVDDWLSPPLRPQQAALVAEAALADTLDVVAAAPVTRRLLALDGAPGDWLPVGFRVFGAARRRARRAARGGVRGRLRGSRRCRWCSSGPIPRRSRRTCSATRSPRSNRARRTRSSARRPTAGSGCSASADRTGRCWRASRCQPRTPAAMLLERLAGAGLRVALAPRLTEVSTFETAEQVAGQCPSSRFAAAFSAAASGLSVA